MIENFPDLMLNVIFTEARERIMKMIIIAAPMPSENNTKSVKSRLQTLKKTFINFMIIYLMN